MGIAARYLFKSFLGIFLLCLVGTIFLFVVIDFVGNTKIWLSRPPEDKYIYYLNFLPHITYLVSPIAVLLASVFSVGNFAKYLELAALKSAGVSTLRILAPILLFGMVLSGFMIYFQDRVLPEANHKRYAINEPKSPMGEGGDPQERFKFLYTASDGLLCHLDYYTAHRHEAAGVTLLKLEKGRPTWRIDARNMRWDTTGWVVSEGTERIIHKDSLEAISFTRRPLPELVDKPSELLDDRVFPDELPFKELEKRVAIQLRVGENPRVYLTHWYFRISSALVNFVMALLGVSLAVNTMRSGLMRNFGIALGITFLYYIALRLGLVMGENGTLPPMQAAWFGNFLFAPIGLFLSWRAIRT
jgi:lipopolysaccharide export system permease protein